MILRLGRWLSGHSNIGLILTNNDVTMHDVTLFKNMEREIFEQLLVEALKELPSKYRRKMDNVEIVVEDRPSPELLEERKIRPGGLLLGLYQGVPATKRGFFYTNVLPDKITVFRENIEKSAGAEENVKETLKKVLIHEIGHHFGLGEKDM